MKYFARLAVFGSALVATASFASATPLLYGSLNTYGSATFGPPQTTLSIDSTGHAVLNLPNSNGGGTTGPAATGTLSYFFGGSIVDYSFDSADISGATPVKILSANAGTDTLTFFATSTGAFSATNIPATQGAIVLYGYIEDVGGSFPAITQDAMLNLSASGTNNNFTEDLTATTPEPGSLVLLGTGLMSGAAGLFRRRKLSV